MAAAEIAYSVNSSLVTQPIPGRTKRRQPLPTSHYVPERLIFTQYPEPTERQIYDTARRVREAYRRSTEASYQNAPSLVEPHPNPLTASIHDILGYHQRRNPSGDFTNDSGLVRDLLLRLRLAS